MPHFKLCLNDVAELAFPKKARQTQKCCMQRNLQLVGGMTMKEWVAQVSELNGYLKDFPAHNGTTYSHLMTTNFWTSWNTKYQHCCIES
eukprot:6422796-Ditylum_brightwellii.AAC.1